MVRRLLVMTALAVMAPASADAGFCIVDYETFEVRDALLPADHDTITVEQSGKLTDWYSVSVALTVMGTPYEKYGLLRRAQASDFAFHAFQGSVPILKLPGDGEIPEVVYLLVDPQQCEVQPYSVVRSGPAPAPGTNQFQ